MDTSRFKRRETQKQRQTVESPFNSQPPVAKAMPTRPRFIDDIQPAGTPVAPATNVINSPKSASVTVFAEHRLPSEPRQRQRIMPAPAQVKVPTRALPPIDMGLPGDESPWRVAATAVRTGRWPGVRRWALRGTLASVVLVVGVGGFLLSQGYLNLHKVFKGGTATAAALKANVDPNLLKGEGSGRVNILLLGRGGGKHDAPDLTDTMMLASVDPVNHTATLFSIPRDLWIDMPNSGAMKINAAWETGEFKYLGRTAPGSTNPNAIQAGFDAADQTVENVLGVTINYNMLVDFQAFKQSVDTVNGVTVNVPSDLIDPTMSWENKGSALLAKAGVQNFDGKHALIYVRSRETTSDFARSQRQRSVLLALKDKAETLGTLSNPLKISGLMSALGNNVSTDLSLDNANRLYSIMRRIPDTSISSVGLADQDHQYVSTGNMNGQSIVLPKSGLFNYKDIQTFVRSQLKDPYIVRENAKILVLNGSTQEGLATTKANELKSYGYNVVGVGNAPTTAYGTTTLVKLSAGRNKYTAHYLERRLNVTAANRMPDTTIQTNGADFVIILGSDEANPSQP
jgi:LCP family protein required for cell wall assembly